MKGKLIKLNVGVGYRLDDEHGDLFASTLQSSKTKLSMQNCDEIFGIVDIEKLAKNHPLEVSNANHGFGIEDGIIYGFNKAVELNKDKLFTVEDMKHAMNRVWSWMRNEDEEEYEDCELINEIENKVIQALQQPTEIEVEIEVEPKYIRMGGVKSVKGSSTKLSNPAYGCKKTDENGCLILKRI